MTVELIFETHSTTEDNENGIATGWLPGKLSRRGRQQAIELGIRRRETGIATVFASDLHRAVETAHIAFGDTGVSIHQDARLRECNYGALNGCTVDVLAAERRRHLDEPFPGGQSYHEVVGAMRDFLQDVARGWDGKRVLIISHSANRWALDCLLCGAMLEDLVDAPFAWQAGWTYTLDADSLADACATHHHEQSTTSPSSHPSLELR